VGRVKERRKREPIFSTATRPPSFVRKWAEDAIENYRIRLKEEMLTEKTRRRRNSFSEGAEKVRRAGHKLMIELRFVCVVLSLVRLFLRGADLQSLCKNSCAKEGMTSPLSRWRSAAIVSRAELSGPTLNLAKNRASGPEDSSPHTLP